MQLAQLDVFKKEMQKFPLEVREDTLVFIYAFHKKTQKLPQKEVKVILSRLKEIK